MATYARAPAHVRYLSVSYQCSNPHHLPSSSHVDHLGKEAVKILSPKPCTAAFLIAEHLADASSPRYGRKKIVSRPSGRDGRREAHRFARVFSTAYAQLIDQAPVFCIEPPSNASQATRTPIASIASTSLATPRGRQRSYIRGRDHDGDRACPTRPQSSERPALPYAGRNPDDEKYVHGAAAQRRRRGLTILTCPLCYSAVWGPLAPRKQRVICERGTLLEHRYFSGVSFRFGFASAGDKICPSWVP
jgi:hypothetical protein